VWRRYQSDEQAAGTKTPRKTLVSCKKWQGKRSTKATRKGGRQKKGGERASAKEEKRHAPGELKLGSKAMKRGGTPEGQARQLGVQGLTSLMTIQSSQKRNGGKKRDKRTLPDRKEKNGVPGK